MRKKSFVAYTGFVCLVGLMAGALLADDDGIYWLDNYAEAIQEAKRTGRPIFLEFRCEP
jgi:hypothetical protein